MKRILALVLLFGLCDGLATIPRPPSDPPAPAGDGIGPYKSQSAGIKDRLSRAKFTAVARAARIKGYSNASKHLIHYLQNTGKTLTIAPESIMKDLPNFKQAARALVQNRATLAYNSINRANGSKAFSSRWNGFYAKKGDWFYALGGYSYSVTGVVTKYGNKGSMKYKIHIFDRYNWDKGKEVTIGPFTFKDSELGNLHLKGLAREYVVRGSSKENSVSSFLPERVIPPPSTGLPRG